MMLHAETDVYSGIVQWRDVHAFQLISKMFRSKNSTYYSYKLYLFLETGQRLNIVDHGRLTWVKGDTVQLSQFLELPVWNVSC